MYLLSLLVKSSDRNFKKIIAKILSKNKASIKFFEKYGFIQEGPETIFNEIILIYNL